MTDSNHYAALVRRILRHNYYEPLPAPSVREPAETYAPVPVSERLVQCLWYDQRLTRDKLKLTDGRALKVIDAGAWNLEAGPDFLRATIQIGDASPQTGDVEIHLRAADWSGHGHTSDSRYNNVILHAVMWEDKAEQLSQTADGRVLPQLILFPHLNAPLDELYDSIDSDAYPYEAHNHAGRCEAILKTMPAESVSALLAEAGDERLNAKARRFARRARRGGSEQAFYESFMEALGYKNNKAPFRQLAQRFTLDEMKQHRTDNARETRLRFEAILLGLAGLLPERELKSWDAASQRRAKWLWEHWWKWRDVYGENILPRTAWNFANLRPANHPQRRLASAAAFLAVCPNPLTKISKIIEKEEDAKRALKTLERWLSAAESDSFWQTHFRLGGKAQAKPSAMLGEERATELILNVILPAALHLSDTQVSGLNPHPSKDRVKEIYAAIPRQPTHSIERYMLPRLFEARSEKSSVLLPTARHQQGLLQIFQDFCLNNTTNCQDCKLPELLSHWGK